MKIIFDDLAVEEFNDAVEYYELQVEGLGRIFREEIKRALRTIRRFPKIRLTVNRQAQRSKNAKAFFRALSFLSLIFDHPITRINNFRSRKMQHANYHKSN